ncbi:MAG: AtpZ/AtpI family protein [Acidimicrobiia bacterium]|nr:AtpZ/AtpI family protein [Acidimicrobiia bacterium]MBT8214125.1 AtpZ/AtpI family protein [Acidimicrobiia bacterium]NNF68255.1 AtpZ/AtpI family protein [Acidimicrobiia bacterium]NNK92553.1 AtpZ/AtpI family protein [Acidimicrobiia bacterium]
MTEGPQTQTGPRRYVANLTEGTGPAFDFFASWISGFLLGFLLDWVFDTRPVFIIIGIVAGAVSGFIKLYRASDVLVQGHTDE